MFVKGKSGNPGGRPKEIKAVIELARKHTVECIKELAKIAIHGETEPGRVAAIKEILDRGWGKASQPIEADVKHDASDTLLNLLERIATSDASRS